MTADRTSPVSATATADPAPAEGRRERLRREELAQIKTSALAQVRAEGAGALNLRAVARAVGMSSPGLYRYYASRDELLAALVAESYLSLAAALEQARDSAGPDVAIRLRAVVEAYFTWATEHPSEWGLIFGAPVPVFVAPPDGATTQAARRFGAVFAGLLAQVWVQTGARGNVVPGLGVRPDAVTRFGDTEIPDDPRFLAAVTRLWSRLHGVIALGVFGHLLPQTLTPESTWAIYQSEIDDQLVQLGLAPAPGG